LASITKLATSRMMGTMMAATIRPASTVTMAAGGGAGRTE
jgi:hypothetical protein